MIHTVGNVASASPFVIPAKAGIRRSAVRASEEWVPAFAGMTVLLW
jgi:hypothetical protein